MPDTPDDRPGRRTLLAFDYGRRRIGVAVGQEVTGSASPVGTAQNAADGPDWATIEAWLKEWQPDRLVVGMPWHADGTASEMTAEAGRFAAQLARFGLPVDTVDERYSSLEAAEGLREARASGRRRRVQRGAVDAVAAALIAERWLAGRGEDSA